VSFIDLKLPLFYVRPPKIFCLFPAPIEPAEVAFFFLGPLTRQRWVLFALLIMQHGLKDNRRRTPAVARGDCEVLLLVPPSASKLEG